MPKKMGSGEGTSLTVVAGAPSGPMSGFERQKRTRQRKRARALITSGNYEALFSGEDEQEVLRELLQLPGKDIDDLLTHPDFQRRLIQRVMLRQISDPKSRPGDVRSASSILMTLSGLDKTSKVAEVTRDIQRVMEELQKRAGNEIDVTPEAS